MAQPEIPNINQYWANALYIGQKHGNALTDATFPNQAVANGFTIGTPQYQAYIDDRLIGHIYYDMSSVMWDISDYLTTQGNALASQFATYAQQADDVYINKYLVPAGYFAQGFRNFPVGFQKSWLKTANLSKKSAAIQLSTSAAYARETTPAADMLSAARAREVAYALYSWLVAEELGESPRARKAEYLELLLGHFDQWFTKRTYVPIVTFMVALASRTLIKYWEKQGGLNGGDSRIVPALENAWEEIWNTMWVASSGAFQYQSVQDDFGNTNPSVDLNLLIVPVYGFLWYVTGAKKWQERGNTIFGAGVTFFDDFGFQKSGAYINDGKQFCQQYYWTKQYIQWATSDPLTAGGTPSPEESEDSVLVQVAPSMLLPVRRETWRERFSRESWTTWKNQQEAGYPYLCQPGAETARFEEVIDLGAVIETGSRIIVSINPQLLDGAGTSDTTIWYSEDGVTYTEGVGEGNVFAQNFRYVKVRIDWSGDSKYLIRSNPIAMRVNVKEKSEAGALNALAADFGAGGTLVNFEKTFADVVTIQVNARYQSLGAGVYPVAYYSFTDTPNPTSFRVFVLRSDTGAAINGMVDYEINGI